MMGGTREPRAHGDLTPWFIIGAVVAGFALLSVLWAGGSVGALLGGGGWHPPPFSLSTLVRFFNRGPAALWPGASPAGVWAGIIVAVAAVATLAIIITRQVLRRTAHPAGLAGPRDVTDLTESGMADRARHLRPSLGGVNRIPAADIGLRLGDLDPHGPALYGSWEDTTLALMGPRSFKTAGVAVPLILRAPGAVVVTSVREDVYTITVDAQRRRRDAHGELAQIWGLDPQRIAFLERDWWWDMLAEARSFEGAWRLAGHFVSLMGSAERLESDFWMSAARGLLTGTFMAAGVGGHPISHVLRWLGNPAETEPLDALKGTPIHGDLRARMNTAPDTREGIYQTAREAVACLLDPDILAWITPDPTRRQFVPDQFAASHDTLYLLAKKGTAGAAGVVAALTDAVLLAAERRADRMAGRLDPPMLVLLDEAANIAKIPDLPDKYSYLGGKGILPVTVIQNYAQGESAWGRTGMAALWSAATIKLIGAGIDDPRLAEDVSKLIDDHDVPIRSTSYGGQGRSSSVTPQLRRIMPPGKIRKMPRGWALLFSTGHPVAYLRLRAWFRDDGADQISKDLRAQREALTERANRSLDGSPHQ
ncbi:MAG: type IV secretory system conjugative DNA transfer family protein [Actinoallomurus sp.]